MDKRSKTLAAIAVVAIIILASFVVVANMKPSTGEPTSGTRQVTDMLGRNVTIPDTVTKVIGVNYGALRMITYLNASDMVCGVEQTETNVSGRPYAMAHPEYADLPVIGPQFGGDPELIAAAEPDVIFDTDPVASNLDSLQQQTGIPVIGIVYGGLDTPANILVFYQGLTLMGNVMHKETRATEVIDYVSGIIIDVGNRVSGVTDANKISVYAGGLSSRGNHGITSTSSFYAPFVLTSSKNVITPTMTSNATGVVNIDLEALPGLNPDVIFVDYNGLDLCRQDVQNHPEIFDDINAIKNGKVYGVMGYNWYTLNYDTVLTDVYYVGKLLYPDQFADVDPVEKADEIYTFLVGAPLYQDMVQLYGPFGAVSLT
jgi:iron complex transport system substrate-binding protein